MTMELEIEIPQWSSIQKWGIPHGLSKSSLWFSYIDNSRTTSTNIFILVTLVFKRQKTTLVP